jgi:hypothetical protein
MNVINENVINENSSGDSNRKHRKDMLCDLRCGAIVSIMAVSAALYIHGPIIMLIAGVFVLMEVFNLYDFFCFCKHCKKQK